MQIDFHHATTYVLARLAGFGADDAGTIAHAAQYVDDATSSGDVHFENKALYRRISSAHKMLDLRNTKETANHLVWLPFHFLPGNDGLPAGQDSDSFIHKIVCRPNSPVAQDMVRQCIVDQKRRYGLHRLGVTMHVYADTWAHQGFAGVLHTINDVEDAKETGNSRVFSRFGHLGDFLRDALDDAIPPLGHGRATDFPDMPFLSWQYTNGLGELVERDNTEIFCDAAQHLCAAMQRYRAGNPDAAVEDIDDPDMKALQDLFANTTLEKGEERHAVWLDAIANGAFSFGAETISYQAKGSGSWKDIALGTSHDLPVHTYKDDFLDSDWKLFHDAVQAHRFYVIHDLLPNYGMCAA